MKSIRQQSFKIAPSLLSADFSRLGEEVSAVTEAGADMIHFDVMDGHFVPNITFGPMVLESIRGFTNLPFDTHLMISRPDVYWRAFADAGSDIIGIHIESVVEHGKIIKEIHGQGKKVCIVVNPPTPVESVEPFLCEVDQVLVMSVNPGFGGQKFIESTVPKIERLSYLKETQNLSFEIEVDGGINMATACTVKRAGADIIVAGSFIFNSGDYKAAIDGLR